MTVSEDSSICDSKADSTDAGLDRSIPISV